jgi:zinc protease
MIKRAAVIAVLASASAGAQEVAISYTEFTLPNGLRVLVHEDHSAPLVATNLLYRVGGIHEQPGRTGFAHLFEHVMFEGSGHVPEGQIDQLITEAGGTLNAGTSFDWTIYDMSAPSNALDRLLWLDADRLGTLLSALSQRTLDVQRDIVKNERRQRYENQPYGLFLERIYRELQPAGALYSWLPIGSMEDLSAASLDDVSSFFRRYYVPNNAVLVVAGDVRSEEVRASVERYFGWIPRGADPPRPGGEVAPIERTRYVTAEDRVTLPQLNLAWRTVPSFSDPDHWALQALAAILADGKSSRLYQRLVYAERTAQTVTASQDGYLYGGNFFIRLTASSADSLDRLERAVDEEIARLATTPPAPEEVQRVVNGLETAFIRSVSTIAGKAEQLNTYLYYTGRPDFITEDLSRVRAITPADVQRAAQRHLRGKSRIVLSIVPQGRTDLAAQPQETAP